MNEALQVLLTDGVIDEVVGRLKSGKEADVYLVRHGGEVVAAKIYKEREHRNFRNNSGYREGRQVRNSRTARAMARGSRFGVKAAEDAWKTAEVEALFKLYAAGVCVPRPVVFYEGVLLMELVLDPDGQPAPRLEEAMLTSEEASALYFDLRNQAIRMLCCDLIHGDLSAFNILLGSRGATIIDLPQVVDAAANSQAERYFTRDLENLRVYFEASDPALRARAGDAQEIWRAYTRRELTPDYTPTGRFVPGPNERSRPPRGNRPPGERPPRRDGEGQRPWREQNARPGGPPQSRPPQVAREQTPREQTPREQTPRQRQREQEPRQQEPRQRQREQEPRPQQAREQAPRQQQEPQQQEPRQQQPREQAPRPQQEPRQQNFRPDDGQGSRQAPREQNARSAGPAGPRPQESRGERPPRSERPRNERSFRGGGDGARPPAALGARGPEPAGGPGPRGRPPERRGDEGNRAPRQGRGSANANPQVSYVQNNQGQPPPAPPKPDEPS